MSVKITTEHLARGAVVYVRQSTLGQVIEHTESQHRQYALVESAKSHGFSPVTVIDDDLCWRGRRTAHFWGREADWTRAASGPLVGTELRGEVVAVRLRTACRRSESLARAASRTVRADGPG